MDSEVFPSLAHGGALSAADLDGMYILIANFTDCCSLFVSLDQTCTCGSVPTFIQLLRVKYTISFFISFNSRVKSFGKPQ